VAAFLCSGFMVHFRRSEECVFQGYNVEPSSQDEVVSLSAELYGRSNDTASSWLVRIRA
jgi:hypothetical protein